ncbi:MAG TPA: cytochrome c oxidase subunit I [Candidatus Limnocylindrales bacterium]|nr:cytochrome c oxidase subunit I [Candidatus Limnocylindrales bacterium]
MAVGTIAVHREERGTTLLTWLTTTDHKRIGVLYMVAAFAFFFVGGLLALVMRAELTAPGLQVVNEQTYNQLFTMHGTIMMLLFGTPMVAALANYLVPLQVGAPDMVFPRLNALSFWLFLFGGLIVMSGYVAAGGPADVGWTGYPPNSELQYSTTTGTDLWIVGLALTGVASILGGLNFVVTIYTRRAPGMSMLRVPIFTWTILVTSILILFAFPALTAALAMLLLDRRFGADFFGPSGGGDPILWQHLFWFFGHPEVYILALPFFGILSEVIPVFSRKPLFGYRAFILATILIGAYSMSVWAHHMFTTGAINLPFFALTSFAIAVPTGIKIFNWIATMFRGRLSFETPMLFCTGFIYLFALGGITGVIVASPPLDFHFQDTYFVVAHLHNVLVGGSVMALFGGIYFWFPKMSGRRLDERLGRLHFAGWTIGFILTFLPQYQLGANGMPRRYADYAANAGWTGLNVVSTIGSLILGLATIPFLIAVFRALRRAPDQPNDPWGGNSLEWWTSSPPPHHNFDSLPAIRSERPVFDARMALLAAEAADADGAEAAVAAAARRRVRRARAPRDRG